MFTAGNPSFLVWCPQALVLQGFVLRMGLQHVLRSAAHLPLLKCAPSFPKCVDVFVLSSLFVFLKYLFFKSFTYSNFI